MMKQAGILALAAALLSVPTVASTAAPLASKTRDTVAVQTSLSGVGSGSRETNYGDLVADAVREQAGTDIALVPADDFTDTEIAAGNVPVTKIIEALKYPSDPGDGVVVLKLTGAQVLRAAERALSRAPEPFPGFLQVSGLQMRYDASAAQGKRVSLVGAGGSEISASASYTVATTKPIADGGLGYFEVWTAKDVMRKTGQSVAETLSAYLANHKTINAVVEGRITQSH